MSMYSSLVDVVRVSRAVFHQTPHHSESAPSESLSTTETSSRYAVASLCSCNDMHDVAHLNLLL